jgi:hypothetical protein
MRRWAATQIVRASAEPQRAEVYATAGVIGDPVGGGLPLGCRGDSIPGSEGQVRRKRSHALRVRSARKASMSPDVRAIFTRRAVTIRGAGVEAARWRRTFQASVP